jgi:hypothetical protein
VRGTVAAEMGLVTSRGQVSRSRPRNHRIRNSDLQLEHDAARRRASRPLCYCEQRKLQHQLCRKRDKSDFHLCVINLPRGAPSPGQICVSATTPSTQTNPPTMTLTAGYRFNFITLWAPFAMTSQATFPLD